MLDRPPQGLLAEAWYGAHPRAPATVPGEGPLDAVIARDPVAWVGPGRAGLPYLLKLLGMAQPLSIQVHPDRAAAEAGFAREDAEGIPRDAPTRCYRDPNPKPELLVALRETFVLCGFRRAEDVARALEAAPEVAALLPGAVWGGEGLRETLARYFALPEAEVLAAWERAAARWGPGEVDDPRTWALEAQRALGRVDRGLLFVFALALHRLAPGEGIYLAPGVPHAYLRGAGVEVMESSDNVLRAGLTVKHVDPEALLAVVRVAPGGALRVAASADGVYRTPARSFQLRQVKGTFAGEGTSADTVLGWGEGAVVRCGDEVLRLRQGEGCAVQAGAAYTVAGEAFCVSVPSAEDRLVGAVRSNVAAARALFAEGSPAAVIGTVSGSEAAQGFWQRQLDAAKPAFRARVARSFHEDLPVNQAFGLLLLWQRLREDLASGEGGLVAFVFGEGSRATPWTEAECGQKPAIAAFVREGDAGRYLTTVELALRTFAPVEAYLRRSGFDGVVVKWGDEVQIPTLDLRGSDPRLAGADVVRFVSLRTIEADDAANKDWVGVDAEGRVTAFIPRRPLAEMAPLAERGLLRREGDRLVGGVNLGSIAASRALLDVLLEAFRDEVNDPTVDRRTRPDLDPQLFTALTIAAIADPAERSARWAQAKAESAAIERLEGQLPGVLERLRGALDVFESRHGRPVSMRAVDFGDQYWGDIGQHRQLRAVYMALRESSPRGAIARELAELPDAPDAQGNWLVRSELGPGVTVRGSVLIDARVERGEVIDSVLIGTEVGEAKIREAFDVQSTVAALQLAPGAGTYKVVAGGEVVLGPGERATTVFFPEGPELLRVEEETPLRERATTYDVPILGNAVSFQEAHARMVAADPAAVERGREAAREVAREAVWAGGRRGEEG